jgi:hypothetical protein
MDGPSQQVSFRLSSVHAIELEKQASASGVSPGSFARRTLIAALEINAAEDTRNRVAELQDEVRKLRQELWTSVAALLAHAGKADPKAAQAWVKNTLIK